MQNHPRVQPYGMSTSIMANLHNSVSAFADQVNPFTMHNIHSPSSSSIFGRNTLPVFTTYSINVLRQQMDESNHEMVNLLTQQIGTMFDMGHEPELPSLNHTNGEDRRFLCSSTTCLPTGSTGPKPATVAVDRTSGSEATTCASTPTGRTNDSR